MTILNIDEDYDYIRSHRLDRLSNFICRFRITSDKLCSLLPDSLRILRDSNANKYDSTKSRTNSPKKTPVIENKYKEHLHNNEMYQKNSVRRNLNTSFTDIGNYSIVEDENNDNFKIKLRKSRNRMESPSVRKSTRNVPRISYADFEYESPVKIRKESDNTPKNQLKTPRRNLNKTEVSFMYFKLLLQY